MENGSIMQRMDGVYIKIKILVTDMQVNGKKLENGVMEESQQ